MMLPWVARSAHRELMALLREEIGELKAERRLLLDRLAVLGLGGALYAAESSETAETAATQEADAEVVSETQDFAEELLRLRRRPAKLADALTRNMRRTQSHQHPGPRIAWIPEGDPVQAALDRAEEMGRRSARVG